MPSAGATEERHATTSWSPRAASRNRAGEPRRAGWDGGYRRRRDSDRVRPDAARRRRLHHELRGALLDGHYALESDSYRAGATAEWFVARELLGTIRIHASSSRTLFIGIAPASAAERYLAGVAHAQATDLGAQSSSLRAIPGGARAHSPAASTSGGKRHGHRRADTDMEGAKRRLARDRHERQRHTRRGERSEHRRELPAPADDRHRLTRRRPPPRAARRRHALHRRAPQAPAVATRGAVGARRPFTGGSVGGPPATCLSGSGRRPATAARWVRSADSPTRTKVSSGVVRASRQRTAHLGAADTAIECDERRSEKFGERHVACIGDRQVRPEFPRSGGEQFIGPVLDRQVEEIGVGLSGLVVADQSCERVASQDVRCLEVDEAGRGRLGPAEGIGSPRSSRACVDQERCERRRIANDASTHRRSASRAARIDSASTRTPVTATRPRAVRRRQRPPGGRQRRSACRAGTLQRLAGSRSPGCELVANLLGRSER